MSFIVFSYPNLETRAVALTTQDPWLCEIFATDGDLYRAVGETAWPEFATMSPYQQRQLRDLAKLITYSLFFGEEVAQIHARLQQEGYRLAQTAVARACTTLRQRLSVFGKANPTLTGRMMREVLAYGRTRLQETLTRYPAATLLASTTGDEPDALVVVGAERDEDALCRESLVVLPQERVNGTAIVKFPLDVEITSAWPRLRR